MKIPALRSHIGNWTYYITTLTFDEVNTCVSKIDDQLHKSDSLKESIQRSITDNYLRIKEYILNQPELFFNSLVLAVYDEYPNWREIEFTYEDGETYQMGLLEFPGNHKIFPLDGQHRVEGIKAALEADPELGSQRIGAIFIGHSNDPDGMQRSRRLFTTLNRYAKPVSLNDIIALDEDDIVAITTRFLLEEYDLFTGSRIVYLKQKAIPSSNKEAITSIITLYQANLAIFKTFFQDTYRKKPTKGNIDHFLKFRKTQNEIEAYRDFCVVLWNAFKDNLDVVTTYLETEVRPADIFRNLDNGGNLIFRPIGFLPLIEASLIIRERTGASFEDIFAHFNTVNLELDSIPWHYVAWDPVDQKMVMNAASIIRLLLIYLYNDKLLNEEELEKLRKGYAAKIAVEDVENVLEDIK